MNNTSDPKVNKSIDLEFLKSVIGDDVEFEKELFAIFIENAHNNVAKMEDALATSNTNSWYMASHAFKGASASIGAFDLSAILEYAQKHPEETAEQKKAVVQKLKDELQLVIEFINQELSDK